MQLQSTRKGRQLKSLAIRFWPKVNIPSDPNACWEWLASHNGKGYGKIGAGGERGPTLKAHRLSWELHFGPISPGLHVLHHCDNPGCINPHHLWLGSNKDNHQDAARKGRKAVGKRQGTYTHPETQARGERHGKSKLTASQVQEIRRRYVLDKITYTTLGREYGVDPSNIGLIIRGKIWEREDADK